MFPAWIMNDAGRIANEPPSLENAGFASGSALALLHLAVTDPSTCVPAELLRKRLAMQAAVNCLKFDRRSDDVAGIRDALLLTAEGNERGPGGDMANRWIRACSISIIGSGWQDRLTDLLPVHLQEDAQTWLGTKEEGDIHSSPVAHAAQLIQAVTKDHPQDEAVGLLFADLAISRFLGWEYLMPLLSHQLLGRQLKLDGNDLLMNCHLALTAAARKATRLAHNLARRATLLSSVAPKLRAKGSDHAIALFLTEDAVLPATMLSPRILGTNTSMSDRSARRLCDRLVELGAVRELTGRPTYRMYGI